VRHRALRFSVAQRAPCLLLVGVGGAVDVLKLGGGGVSGETVEHAAGADRGELLAVPDGDQLRPGALHKGGQGIHAPVVDHPGLVDDHRRVPSDVDGAGVRAGDERVEGECLPGERGAVGSEALGGGAGDGDGDRLPSGVLLRAHGGVDHDSLAGPGGPDEDRGALRAGEDPEGVVLLGGERPADALGRLAGGVAARGLPDVPAGGPGELGRAAFDRLLLRADREGRHPLALQGQYPSVADHLAGDAERLIRRHLSGGLLQRDRAQVALLEDGVLFGQLRLDAVLDRTGGRGALRCVDEPHGLLGAERVGVPGLCPHPLQVRTRRRLLGPAVLQREAAKLAAFRRAATAGTEALRRPGDLAGAAGERFAQPLGNAGDLDMLRATCRGLCSDPDYVACRVLQARWR
jgi:hypothetical protein